MAGRKYVDVIPGLWSMGADYHYDGPTPLDELDPEMTILKTLKCYWDANDVFFMLYALLKFRIGPLVHVERLVKLAQTGFLSNDEIILLIVVSKKLVEDGDHRFKIVYKKLYKKGMKLNQLPRLHGRKSLVKLHGAEESFLEFDVKVRKFINVDDRKLRSVKTIFNRNAWLKLRALMGPNYRADVMYLISSGQAKTVSEAAKMGACNYSAAYRLLRYSDDFEHLEKVLDVS